MPGVWHKLPTGELNITYHLKLRHHIIIYIYLYNIKVHKQSNLKYEDLSCTIVHQILDNDLANKNKQKQNKKTEINGNFSSWNYFRGIIEALKNSIKKITAKICKIAKYPQTETINKYIKNS